MKVESLIHDIDEGMLLRIALFVGWVEIWRDVSTCFLLMALGQLLLIGHWLVVLGTITIGGFDRGYFTELLIQLLLPLLYLLSVPLTDRSRGRLRFLSVLHMYSNESGSWFLSVLRMEGKVIRLFGLVRSLSILRLYFEGCLAQHPRLTIPFLDNFRVLWNRLISFTC